jgi:hypothetical protein
MSEFKFLNDGRKVKVIGKLNNQEMIVQEIFITQSGDEIPSGESFVTKSLHDQPVISYKDKEAIRSEERLQRTKLEIEKAEKDQYEITEKLKAYREILRQSKKLVDLFPEQEFEVLTAFMTGTIEYIIVDSYHIKPPVKMFDAITYFESNYGGGRHFDGIKLCSFLGKSDGKTEYHINRWSDGSGSDTRVYPFTTYEAAIAHIKERAISEIEKGELSEKDYSECMKIGIKLSEEQTQKYIEKRNERAKKVIANHMEEIAKHKEEVEKLAKSLVEK